MATRGTEPSRSQAAWQAVLASQRSKKGNTMGKKFGTESLSVQGKVFAMHYKGNLVLKLPRERVAQLMSDGQGDPFTLGKRTMAEWVSVSPKRAREWPAMAEEARAFVGPSKK